MGIMTGLSTRHWVCLSSLNTWVQSAGLLTTLDGDNNGSVNTTLGVPIITQLMGTIAGLLTTLNGDNNGSVAVNTRMGVPIITQCRDTIAGLLTTVYRLSLNRNTNVSVSMGKVRGLSAQCVAAWVRSGVCRYSALLHG